MRTRRSAALLVFVLALGAGSAHCAELKPWGGGATPPLALKDSAGAVHDLKTYRGKVVLVNFWATWCEPCRDEMPSLQRLKARLGDRAFSVLAVNFAESEAKVSDFVRRFDLDLTVVFDRDSSVARKWSVRLLPASFIIDARGRLRYTLFGEANWDAPEFAEAISALLPAAATATPQPGAPVSSSRSR